MIKINPLISFIRQTLKKTGHKRLVLALSGGVDSATSAFLAAKAIGAGNLFILLLPYGKQDMTNARLVIRNLKIPSKNVFEINLEKPVKTLVSSLRSRCNRLWQSRRDRFADARNDIICKGNILARLRMIYLFDAAKRLNALVCGTENRSEHLLGYFTRFGDEASDIEPIVHLYKTQVYQLARQLGVPEKIIRQSPTAGLWEGQTDEKELGFSYQEADPILKSFFDEKKPANEIEKKFGEKITRKVLKRVRENLFKYQTPYKIQL